MKRKRSTQGRRCRQVRCQPALGEGSETGQHPDRVRIPGVTAQGLAWLDFRNPAREGTENSPSALGSSDRSGWTESSMCAVPTAAPRASRSEAGREPKPSVGRSGPPLGNPTPGAGRSRAGSRPHFSTRAAIAGVLRSASGQPEAARRRRRESRRPSRATKALPVSPGSGTAELRGPCCQARLTGQTLSGHGRRAAQSGGRRLIRLAARFRSASLCCRERVYPALRQGLRIRQRGQPPTIAALPSPTWRRREAALPDRRGEGGIVGVVLVRVRRGECGHGAIEDV